MAISTIFILSPVVNAQSLSPQEIEDLNSGILYYNASSGDCSTGGSSSSSVTLTGSDNAQKVWNYFISQGLTQDQTAGVMGNLYAQDGAFNPEQVQIPPGGNSTTPTTQKNLGWGLAQWTPTSGENPIIPAAQIAGVPPDQMDTLAGQLTIIWSEMKTGTPPGVTDMLKILEQQTTVAGATQIFFQDFEGGGTGSTTLELGYANQILKDYGNSNQTSTTDSNSSSDNCDASSQVINCSNKAQSYSTLSTLRQDIVCIAKSQVQLWKNEPYTWRYTGYYDYSNGVTEEWCADFVSWVYNQAGDPFPDGVRDGWDVSYVGDIPGVSEATAGFTYHPVGKGDPSYTPVPGDIGIFYTNMEYGHTAIYIGNSGSTSLWIGGDQGPSPDGDYGGADSESTVNVGYNEPGSPGYIMGYVSPNDM